MIPTATERRLEDPLTPETRRERRALLGLSTLALFVAYTGAVPAKVSALDVDLSAAPHAVVTVLLGLVLYFLIVFGIGALTDLSLWRIRLRDSLQSLAHLDAAIGDTAETIRTTEDRIANGKALMDAFLSREASGYAPHADELRRMVDLRKDVLDTFAALPNWKAVLSAREEERRRADTRSSRVISVARLSLDVYFPLALGGLAIVSCILLFYSV